MSVFAFCVADASLYIFASPAEALRCCPVEEILAQGWLFFAGDGSPLRCEAGVDAHPFLRPWASCSSCSLPQMLPYVQRLQGGDETLEALRGRFGASLAS